MFNSISIMLCYPFHYQNGEAWKAFEDFQLNIAEQTKQEIRI